MSRKRVVVTDQWFGGVRHEAAAARRFDADFAEYSCSSEAATVEAVRDADVAFVNFAPMTATALAAMRPGALVVRYGIGVDNVDLAAAKRLGVRVANVPDYGSDTVADHAAACMLALLRKLGVFDSAVRRKGWASLEDGKPLPGLSSSTVGLIGVGRIGLALARRLRPFGIRLLAADPFADAGRLADEGITLVERDRLLAEAHGVSLHLPATAETRHLINAETLARMRRGAVLVNTARGALIDEAALADALRRGHLGGAALDVFDPEPLALDSPLRDLPNLILTPHVAFYSDDSLDALQRLAAEEAMRALAGEPLRCPVV